jgi:hypothetical protein
MAVFTPSEIFSIAPVFGVGVAGGDGVSDCLHANKESAHNMNNAKVRLKIPAPRRNRFLGYTIVVSFSY